MQKRYSLLAALAALVVSACGDAGITSPTAVDASLGATSANPAGSPPPHAQSQLRAPSVRWNELARTLVADSRVDPPMAARIYALLGVAQHSGVVEARNVGGRSHKDRPELDATVGAVVAASAEVLAYAFPNELTRIRVAEQVDAAPYTGKGNQPKFFEAGREIGRGAAARALAVAKSDGAGSPWAGDMPGGEGAWTGTAPLRPLWGSVRPWLLSRGDQFRPPPPPAFGSREFLAALAEVREISDTRTPRQLAIAVFWSDGLGTSTPPGHWNEIAAGLIEKYRFDEERATRTLKLLDMAMMDAGIACWDAKYHYWLLRPSQADPNITTPVGLPNFPSYVSGHATFSGAAAELLGAIFPAERGALMAMADEAAMSRLYGGIHYRFDNDEGLALGRRIGALAVREYEKGERERK
jgi:membrane-associated phospholipid phosphatase